MSNKDYDEHEMLDSSDEEHGVSPQASHTTGVPADFSQEEWLFAREMGELFCVDGTEQGELPPYYAQTLLEAHRQQAADEALVQRTRARVLRRLGLQRQIVYPARSGLRRLLPRPLPPGRPLAAMLSACLLVMCITVALTLPFFSTGLTMVLGEPKGGVQQASRSLRHLTATALAQQTRPLPGVQQLTQVNLSEAQSQLQFPMYWPREIPTRYQLNGIYLYQGTDQLWADGPIADLEYSMNQAGVIPAGSGKISVCEFKPMGKVLQEVQIGQARLQLDSKGNAAILLDQTWVQINDKNRAVYEGRGELIYEQSGILFWIDGDERDGVTEGPLLAVARSLNILDPQQVKHMMMLMGPVPAWPDGSSDFFDGQVTYVNNPDGTLTAIVGAGPSLNKDTADFS